jgi:hypothetical protein
MLGGGPDLGRRALKCMVDAARLVPPDWPTLARDGDLLAEVVIDTADRHLARVIVVGASAEVESLVDLARRYGRRCEWVVAADAPPSGACAPVLRLPDDTDTGPPPRAPLSVADVEAEPTLPDRADAARWLFSHAKSYVDRGEAPMLADHFGSSLAAAGEVGLLVAVEAGRADLLAELPPLPDLGPTGWWLESRRALLLGRVQEAAAAARRAASAPEASPQIRIEAACQAVRLAAGVTDPDSAMAGIGMLLEGIAGAGPGQVASLATVLALAGELAVATRFAVEAHAALIQATDRPSTSALEATLEACIFTDQVARGLDLWARWGDDAHRVFTPGLAYSAAFVLLQSGCLPDAERLTERLSRFARRGGYWARGHRFLTVRASLAVGGFAGADAEVDRLEHDAVAGRDVLHAAMARGLDYRLAWLRGSGVRLSAWPSQVPAPSWRHARRPDPTVSVGEPPTDRWGAMSLVAAAERLASAGDRPGALSCLSTCAAWLEERGMVLDRTDVAVVEALVGLAHDDDTSAKAGLDRLRGVAWGSPRHAAEAAVLGACAKSTPRWGMLEAHLSADDVSPLAARVARAAMGVGAAPTPLLARLATTLHLRWGAPPTARHGPPEKPGWGYDPEREIVWRWNGPDVCVAEAPTLARLLRVLFAATAPLSKADLAEQVWDLPDYHPLRDDKRMQVAIRKLRQWVEVDPARPVRVVTTEGGYGLGATEPARRR